MQITDCGHTSVSDYGRYGRVCKARQYGCTTFLAQSLVYVVSPHMELRWGEWHWKCRLRYLVPDYYQCSRYKLLDFVELINARHASVFKLVKCKWNNLALLGQRWIDRFFYWKRISSIYVCSWNLPLIEMQTQCWIKLTQAKFKIFGIFQYSGLPLAQSGINRFIRLNNCLEIFY